MVFYNYTIKKMLKSASTWITFVITVLPIWGFAIAMFAMNAKDFSNSFIVISFFIVALPIIFVAYQSIKVFRDEIENNTILSLQTKPISRTGMIFQGLLAIITSLSLMLFFLILVPGLLLGIQDENMFLTSITVFSANFLILSIFAIICFRLSLTFSGKSFIGIIVGGFGVGFYLLYILSFAMKNISSIDKNTNSFIEKIESKSKSYFNSSVVDSKPLGNNTFQISANKNSTTTSVKELYDLAKSNNNVGAYDVIEWFNPTSHWMRMFGAISKSSIDESGKASLVGAMFSGKSIYVENIKDVKFDASKHIIGFTFQLKQKDSLPVYYPFILWIVIGAVLIPLSIRSIQKRNIS